MIGNVDVGKTCLLMRLCEDRFPREKKEYTLGMSEIHLGCVKPRQNIGRLLFQFLIRNLTFVTLPLNWILMFSLKTF